MSRQDAYTDLQRNNVRDPDELESLSIRDVRTVIGESARGLTVSSIVDLQQRLVSSLRQEQMQATVDEILIGIRHDYPKVEAKLLRHRKIEIWLDGLPEEIK